MKARTRRRLTGTLAVVAAGAVLYATGNTWAAAIAGAAVLLLGLIRPSRPRHRRPRTRRAPRPRILTRRALDLEHTPHVLYRIYNHGHDLIYIGICVTHARRTIHDRVREHARKQPWWNEVARVDAFETYPTRSSAFTAEKAAIDAAEAAGIQLHNRVHNEHWQPYQPQLP